MKHRIPTAAALLALGAVVASCSSTEVTAPEPQVIEETTFDPSLGIDLSLMTRTASGLYYQDLEPGEGPVAEAGDSVTVRYAGYLSNGVSFDAGDLPPYVVDQANLIPGFAEAVRGMREGGVRKAVIPPALGYGSAGRGGIPGGAILIFDLEMLSLVKGPF